MNVRGGLLGTLQGEQSLGLLDLTPVGGLLSALDAARPRGEQPVLARLMQTQPTSHDQFNHDPFNIGVSEATPGWAGRLQDGMLGQAVAGIGNLVSEPSRQMQPNPYPPGSEEASWYDDQLAKARYSWAPEMAMNMVGLGGPSAMVRGASLGAAGGRIGGPKVVLTPQMQEGVLRNKWTREGPDLDFDSIPESVWRKETMAWNREHPDRRVPFDNLKLAEHPEFIKMLDEKYLAGKKEPFPGAAKANKYFGQYDQNDTVFTEAQHARYRKQFDE